MKELYIAPCTRIRMIEACHMLCVSGNVDSGSGSNEGEEDMDMSVKRSSLPGTNTVKWDSWE